MDIGFQVNWLASGARGRPEDSGRTSSPGLCRPGGEDSSASGARSGAVDWGQAFVLRGGMGRDGETGRWRHNSAAASPHPLSPRRQRLRLQERLDLGAPSVRILLADLDEAVDVLVLEE